MGLKFYASTPGRRTRQLAADIGFVCWGLFWLWVATRVHDLVLMVGAPGEGLESMGSALAENMAAAGDGVDELPVVGDGVSAPFDRMAEAGQSLADTGRAQQEAVDRLAVVLAGCIALIPIGTLLVVWLPLRVRFARRAGAAQRFIDSSDDLDLFALRALSRQPMHLLAAIDDDPAGAWRRRDPVIIRELAALELHDEGLRMPA